MAFSMNNMSSTFGTNTGSPTVHDGDDVSEIPEILTEQVGFKGLNGDKKARILNEPWPTDNLPPPYSSLLSIAPARGLYAAASPSTLVLGKTEDVRSRIYSESKSEDIFDCQPIQTFPHQRLTHVAFASDESCLVVAEQSSSEIVAYDVKGLVTGNQNLKVTLSTSAPIRAVAANPDPAQAHLFALLNTNGQLLLANLQGKAELSAGTNGPVLAENITCLAWSTKGKQILAGKADGTAVQLKPDGSIVAGIPKPAFIPGGYHLAQIAWTETDVFMFIYTPSSVPEDDTPESHYCIVQTNKARTNFTFHKTANDLVFPMIPRTPAHFHITRLREYGPNLDELLCMTASVSSEIKMITKSKKPLSGEISEDNAYTITVPDNESLHASLPMNQAASEDTTAIGMAIDLSDRDPIIQPIVGDPEISQSDGPLPLLAALNDEGILRVWVVAYNDAIREKLSYPGFADVRKLREILEADSTGEEDMDTGISQSQSSQNQHGQAATGSTPSFASPSAGTASPFGQQVTSPPVTLAAGTGFSKPTPIGGEAKTSWTSTGFSGGSQQTSSGFGAPGFGTTPALGSNTGPAFGKAGTIGGGGQQPAASPAFGKAGFGAPAGQSSPFAAAGNSSSSPFASTGTKPASGFGAFANQNGFGTAKPDSTGESPFGKFSNGGGFGSAGASSSSPFASSALKSSSTFGQPSGSSTFGKPSPISSGFGGSAAPAASPFGGNAKSGFKLDSTFTKDETSKEDDSRPDDSGFGFGGFGKMLGSNAKKSPPAADKEEEMEDGDNDEATPVQPPKQAQETPPSTLNQPKTTTTPHVSSLFGSGQPSTTPPTQQKSSTGWSFGNVPSTTPKDTPAPTKFIFGTQPVTKSTPALVAQSEPNQPFAPAPSVSKKEEQVSENVNKREGSSATRMPEAPLPPDPFSKPGYQTGDTSASSLNSKGSREAEDAPLPPDFIPAGKNATQSIKTEESELPPDSLSSDFGESGDDLSEEVSGEEEQQSEHSEEDEEIEHVQTSPESSFGHAADQSPVASPTGGPFTKVSKVEPPKQMKPLFGELGQPGPVFAPPKPQPQQSPRSPSPVRKSMSNDLFRSTERSVSAPAGPKSFLQQKKTEHQQSPFAIQAAKAREEEAAREAARMEAVRKAREEAEAREKQPLVDDEDTIIRMALAQTPEPKQMLDPFITIQPVKALQDLSGGRIDIHSQIERLYEDINSMVNTLGINARSLKEYMMYQNNAEPNPAWPSVLNSDTPIDALNDELFLGDINSLPAGCTTLDEVLGSLEIKDMMKKLDDCQNLLTQEVSDLRARITAMRRSTQARAHPEKNARAPLSAEQSSIQQDLRRSSAAALTNLGQIEDSLVLLRAKLADLGPSRSQEKSGMFGLGPASQRKPSVEAVINTVTKMTAMAEKKSADVDVLEAQLRKLNMDGKNLQQPTTPERRVSRRVPTTPGSGASTVYHTPESHGARSVRATPSRNEQMVVSVEDRDKWQTKARRRKDVAASLKAVLQAKHGKATA